MRRTDAFAALAALLILAAIAGWLRREQPVLSGPFVVIDGDTGVIDGRRIRLAGLDAPELGQSCTRAGRDYPCGQVAREALRALTHGQRVTCHAIAADRFGRTVATCAAADADLGRALVSGGFAVAYGRYAGEEREARDAGRGLWAGTFDRPADWRRAHSRTDAVVDLRP